MNCSSRSPATAITRHANNANGSGTAGTSNASLMAGHRLTLARPPVPVSRPTLRQVPAASRTDGSSVHAAWPSADSCPRLTGTRQPPLNHARNEPRMAGHDRRPPVEQILGRDAGVEDVWRCWLHRLVQAEVAKRVAKAEHKPLPPSRACFSAFSRQSGVKVRSWWRANRTAQSSM